ncbi:MAG: hypothetical protein WCB31_10200 [Nitrososphaeraceae archaeon]
MDYKDKELQDARKIFQQLMLQKDEEIKLIKTEQLTYKEMIRSEV